MAHEAEMDAFHRPTGLAGGRVGAPARRAPAPGGGEGEDKEVQVASGGTSSGELARGGWGPVGGLGWWG